MTDPALPEVTVVERGPRLPRPRPLELWEYRELLYFLVWRDLKVRYKQTVLGATWAILQPLITAAVFTLFFGTIAGISSDGIPYPLFSYTGLLAWTFFAQAVNHAAMSLVGSAQLLTKVYFPREVVPTAAVLAALVDLAVASPVLVLMMVVYGVPPGPRLVAVPALLLLAVVAAAGTGLWLAALNVQFRDVRYVVPFMIQIWLFLTPVIYPASEVAPRLERIGLPGWLIGLNPMTGVVEGLRWAVLGTSTAPGSQIFAGIAAAVVFLVSGAVYFRAVERSFADVV
jgi:lipopolysaccharide transport system permease protein